MIQFWNDQTGPIKTFANTLFLEILKRTEVQSLTNRTELSEFAAFSNEKQGHTFLKW